MAKGGLGRGFGSIINEDAVMSVESVEDVLSLRLSVIGPNKNQPRRHFDADKLHSLAESIRQNGVISPIVVTKTDTGYEIVAGERRWRAAKLAGLTEIPAIVRNYSPQKLTEVALIENIQREDLNPIEEAQAYRALMEDYDLTQEQISERLGKSRSAIANSVRLLSLEDGLQKYVISGQISEGHARCVLSLEGTVLREFLIGRIIEDGLSVRQTEKLAKDLAKAGVPKPRKKTTQTDIQVELIRKSMEEKLGTKVKISHGAKKGRIEIEYYGNRDLDRLLEVLGLN